MLALVLALAQLAMLGRDVVLVTHAAREGARLAAVTTDEDRVRAVVTGMGLAPERLEIDVRREGGLGDAVTVEVSYRSPLPLTAWIGIDEAVVRRAIAMRQETP